jgi:hypothetical protein
VKYLPRIAASGALLVVALGIVTFAQIKFAPQSADNNPVARIVLNVESQLNGGATPPLYVARAPQAKKNPPGSEENWWV